jgi:hypothetical protein
MCPTCCNINFARTVYMFRMFLTINRSHGPTQHQSVRICYGTAVFTLRCELKFKYYIHKLQTSNSHEEAGSDTSTVALRVVGGDKKEVSNLRQ